MSVCTDTRRLQPGDIFVALRGERYDGHDFVEAALAAQASAAVVEAASLGRYPAALRPRLHPVPDTLRALQDMAAAARRQWGGRVVAVTGSAGKTTTKEMIAAALRLNYRVHKTEGNLNNHVGLPLSLLRLEPQHQIAVVEMGMNHAGEIARLCEIAAPDVGVFTNVSEAHLGNFSSVEEIAEAKRELARAIPPAGALVLNASDPRVARFGEGFAGRVRFYQGNGSPLEANRAAALAVAELLGVAPAAATQALADFAPLPGRGEIIRRGGITVINDCYNANPAAMEAMLRVLATTPGARHIAVLGAMRELGDASPELHRRVGAAAAHACVDELFAVQGEARFYLEGASAAGMNGRMRFLEDTTAAATALGEILRPGDVVLLKASRAVTLEAVLPIVWQLLAAAR